MKPVYRKAVIENGFQMWIGILIVLIEVADGSYVEHTIKQIENFSSDEPMVVLLHERRTTLEHLEELLTYLQKRV